MYVKSIGRFALERHVKQRSYLALDGTVPTKSARMYELLKHIVQAYEENDPLGVLFITLILVCSLLTRFLMLVFE